jgi:hypothetical protein
MPTRNVPESDEVVVAVPVVLLPQPVRIMAALTAAIAVSFLMFLSSLNTYEK